MIKKGNTAPHFAVKANGVMKFSVKDVDTSTRTIRWVGNTYKFLDSDMDVLMPGCAKQSISMWGPESNGVAKIKHAVGHDLTLLPGKIMELQEGTLNYKGQNIECLHGATKMADTTLGNDTLTNYLEEIYDNHSIGFQYMKYQFLERGHGNSQAGKDFNALLDEIINPEEAENANMLLRVDEIKLFEISTVAFGANSLTPYLGSKTGNPESLALLLTNRMTKLQETIKKGTQSDDMMHNIEIQILQIKQLQIELFGDVDVREGLKKKAGNTGEQPSIFTGLADDLKKSFSK